MSYYVVYLWKHSMWVWKECIFTSLGWKVLYVSIKCIWSRVLLNVTISFLILCLEDLSIVESGVFKSPTMSVMLSIPFLKSSKIFLLHLDSPMLGAYVIIMFMSSWWILPVSIMKCLSGFLFMAFVLKSILSDISIAIPGIFFFQPFTFSLCRSFVLRWVSCRQHMYGSCFLMHAFSYSMSFDWSI